MTIEGQSYFPIAATLGCPISADQMDQVASRLTSQLGNVTVTPVAAAMQQQQQPQQPQNQQPQQQHQQQDVK